MIHGRIGEKKLVYFLRIYYFSPFFPYASLISRGLFADMYA